jgi:hypothetical protein
MNNNQKKLKESKSTFACRKKIYCWEKKFVTKLAHK